jgi:hypothetical protein
MHLIGFTYKHLHTTNTLGLNMLDSFNNRYRNWTAANSFEVWTVDPSLYIRVLAPVYILQ